ncbi:polyphosphate kinase 1 [Bacteroidota bacterium]
MKNKIFFNRELSWLSFNYRVLQEVKDVSVPLYERLKFMAIYSSNLDEFFRVRVASLRSLLRLNKEKTKEKLKFNPSKLLNQIHDVVNSQQEELGEIYRSQILTDLKENNIYLVNEKELNDSQKDFVLQYFKENVAQYIKPELFLKNKINSFLQNRKLYLVLNLSEKLHKNNSDVSIHNHALVEIPTDYIPRFISLPESNGKHYIMFLDDIIRFSLPEIFSAYNYNIVSSYSVKLTRDAELYIDDEFSGNLLFKIKKGLTKRNIGVPSRFLFDKEMPKNLLKLLKESLDLEKEDLVPGGKYHNFNDFFSFPNPTQKSLSNEQLNNLSHKALDNSDNIFNSISISDYGLHFPYQKYDYVINFLKESANDPKVTSIKITQYRVTNNSEIVKALIEAANKGKEVTAFVEVKARFDEELNIKWAEEMAKAGIKVFYSFPGLKVHAKIAIITRKEEKSVKKYCYLGTGNFNEKTAKIYSDFGLLTSDERLTNEVEQVFNFLMEEKLDYKFKHLLVAQFNMRKKFNKLIENEIRNAQSGKKAYILLKMNSLEDKKMINKLYNASQAGVKIDIIIRGVCCLIPGLKGISDNINIISIVDRYLEHARLYLFYNNGKEILLAASADWMRRNLSRRIEVGFPVYDENIKTDIKKILELQLNDNIKARIIDNNDSNNYKRCESEEIIQAQLNTHEYLKYTYC